MSSQDAGFPPGITAGSLGRRVLAYVIDAAPLAVIGAGAGAAVTFVPRDDLRVVLGLVGLLLYLGWIVLLWWTQGTRGASPGMRLMNLEVVGVENGRPIGWLRAILRSVIFGALAGTTIGLILLLVLMVLNPRRQGWHDLASRAVVINARQPQSQPMMDLPRGDQRVVGLPPSTGGAGTVGLPAAFGGGQSAAPHGAQSGPGAPAAYGQSGQFGQSGQSGQPAGGPQPYGTPSSASSAPSAAPGPISGVPFGQFGAVGSPVPTGQQAQTAPPGVMPGATPVGQPGHPGPSGHPDAGGSLSGPRVVTGVPAPGAPGHASPFGAPPADDEGMDSTRLVQRTGNQRRPDQGWTVVLSDGRQIAVESLVLIGRNPQPRAGEEGAELVSVQDNSRTVSKTHIAVGVDPKGVYVMDRGSTNGSAIATSSGQFEPCAAGDLVRVREGQVVSFGDQRFEIRRTYPAPTGQ